MPAQNAEPAPVRITALTERCMCRSPSAWLSSPSIARVSALRLAGRLRMMVPAYSCRLIRTRGAVMGVYFCGSSDRQVDAFVCPEAAKSVCGYTEPNRVAASFRSKQPAFLRTPLMPASFSRRPFCRPLLVALVVAASLGWTPCASEAQGAGDFNLAEARRGVVFVRRVTPGREVALGSG